MTDEFVAPHEVPQDASVEAELEELMDNDEFAAPDPTSTITIRTSGGETRYVPTSEPLTVNQVLNAANLTVGGVVEYWLNGARIQPTDLVPAGQALTIVGSVKGGNGQ